MGNIYTTSHSGFFYISGANLTLTDKSWHILAQDKNRLLCLSNPGDAKTDNSAVTRITIGHRHDNGDGFYCIVSIDTKGDHDFIESDIAGGVPVFWFSKGDVTIAASGMELLINLAKNLGFKLTLNLNACSELLIASYIYTEMQTGVEDVKLLPPKSRLTINRKNGNTDSQKTAPDFTYSNDELKWDTAKETFKRGLQEGAARYKGKKVACLLSGGADSRIVALSAVKSGVPVDFYTFGQSTVNISDFYVSSNIGYKLKRRVNCFSTSAQNFRSNWKQACSNSNWINDSVWWAGRIPLEMFAELKKYDVIIRGDGDGVYGWKSDVANVSDILHMIEIAEPAVFKKYSGYFREPESVFGPAETSRSDLINRYSHEWMNLRNLTNIIYQRVREPRGIAPGIWHFSGLTAVDAPLLWNNSLQVAGRIPEDKRNNKQIIFEVLKSYDEVSNVPFSTGGSWDNQLEFYYTGLWEELIEYIGQHSPWAVDTNKLSADYSRPSFINADNSFANNIYTNAKKILLKNSFARKLAFSLFPSFAGSSLSARLIIRLAMVSYLSEIISGPDSLTIVSTRNN